MDIAKSPLLTNEKFCQGFFCGAYLLLGIYSFAIKMLLPVIVATAEASIWLSYVTWDLWWGAYLFIAWKIQYPSKKVWIFCMLAVLSDFFISGYKLLTFTMASSQWDVWNVSLFLNNLASFTLSFLFFFYLFSHSTRKEFGAEPAQIP